MTTRTTTKVIFDAIEQSTGVSLATLRSGQRTRTVSEVRAIACYVLRRFRLSASEVADVLDMDHTSVLYAANRVKERPDLLREATEIYDFLT